MSWPDAKSSGCLMRKPRCWFSVYSHHTNEGSPWRQRVKLRWGLAQLLGGITEGTTAYMMKREALARQQTAAVFQCGKGLWTTAALHWKRQNSIGKTGTDDDR